MFIGNSSTKQRHLTSIFSVIGIRKIFNSLWSCLVLHIIFIITIVIDHMKLYLTCAIWRGCWFGYCCMVASFPEVVRGLLLIIVSNLFSKTWLVPYEPWCKVKVCFPKSKFTISPINWRYLIAINLANKVKHTFWFL